MTAQGPDAPAESQPALETVAHTLGFVEGPLWTSDGGLLVASLTRGRIYRIDLEACGGPEVSEFAEPGGGPNCLAQDANGDIWITQTAGRIMPSRSAVDTAVGLQRLDLETGDIEQVPLPGADCPSDCAVDSSGQIWFTDPPVHDPVNAPPTGSVRVYDPRTGELATAAEGLAFPNGLAFSADEEFLFVAETARRRLVKYARKGRTLERTGWTAALPHGHPDGIAVDAAGGLWVAGSVGGNICYVHPDGTPGRSVQFPAGSLVTSACFIGADRATLAVTNAKGGQVAAFRPAIPGISSRSLT